MNNNLLRELSSKERTELLKLVANEEIESLRKENTKLKALVSEILAFVSNVQSTENVI